MSHKNLKLSADARSRKPVVGHANVKSVHVNTKRVRRNRHFPIDVKDAPARVLPGSPGSGAAPGSNGPPTTGSWMPGTSGGPMGC